jgi:GH18 family chitinase
MRASSINTYQYTHVHWGFGIIGSDFSVSVNDSYKQWGNFTTLPNVKKVISFGGWGYSTDPATYNILRSAMNPSNVGKFTDNIVSFLTSSKLDGVDIDWEYPGVSRVLDVYVRGRSTNRHRPLTYLESLLALLRTAQTI